MFSPRIFLLVLLSISGALIDFASGSSYTPDNDWIRIDSNFPHTSNDVNGSSAQFFYIRGGHNVTLKVKNEFLQMPHVGAFKLKFDVWQSNVECAKDFIVKPEKKTLLNHDDWNHIQRDMSYEEFLDFYIRMVSENRPEMVVALKNIELNYENYDQSFDDSVKNVQDTTRIHPIPTLISGSDAKNAKQDVLLFNCDTTDCKVEFGNIREDLNVTIMIRHRVSALVTITDSNDTLVSTKGKSSSKHTLKLQKGDSVSLHITATTSEAVQLIVLDDAPIIFSSFENTVQTSQVAPFLAKHKTSKILLKNPEVEHPENVLIGEAHTLDGKNCCYTLNMKIQDLEYESVAVYVESHTAKFANRYKLFNLSSSYLQTQQQISFCINEFIFNPVALFKNTKEIQFMLQVTGSHGHERDLKTRFALFDIQHDQLESDKIIKQNFLRENQPAWSRILPSQKVRNSVTIGESPRSQQIILNSLWIKNHPKLNAAPIAVQFKAEGTLKTLPKMKFEAFICDELADCITTNTTGQVQVDLKTSILSIRFDRHPNPNSEVVRLHLIVDVVDRVNSKSSIDITMKSFGDPCYPQSDYCSTLNGPHSTCDSQKATIPNDVDSACVCNASKLCSDAHIDYVCSKKSSFECICIQTSTEDSLLISSGGKDCVAFKPTTLTSTDDKNYLWDVKFAVSTLKYYDVCFKMPSPKNAIGLAKMTASLLSNKDQKESITLFDSIPIRMANQTEILFDFCLNQLVNTQRDVFEEFDRFQLNFESDKKIVVKTSDLIIYGKNVDKKQKMISKWTEFESILQVPSNVLSSVADQKFKFKYDSFDSFEVRVYGSWIKNYPKLSSNLIDQNILLTTDTGRWKQSFEICRPRRSGDDCIKLIKNRKISSILNRLDSDQIQVVLVLSSDKKAEKLSDSEYPIGTVSMWDTCRLYKNPCQNRAKCTSSKNNIDSFSCTKDCPKEYSGKLCHLKIADSCSKENVKTCQDHNAHCVPEEKGKFRCDCPKGYEWNHNTTSCNRMLIRNFQRFCTPHNLDECWLDTTLYDRFNSMPKYFPKLSLNDTHSKKNLLFTFTSKSKVTVDFSNEIGDDENDVCIHFRYFLSSSSRLIISSHQPAKKSVFKLVTLEANQEIKNTRLSLSEPTTLCLRDLLPFGALKGTQHQEIIFESEVNSNNDTVAIEFLPKYFDQLVEIRPIQAGERPNTALTYLSKATNEQYEISKDTRQANQLAYQWPVQIPSNRISMDKTSPSTKMKYSAATDTLRNVIFESSWIQRPIQSSRQISGQINLHFTVKSSDSILIEVNILDTSRNVLAKVHDDVLSDRKIGIALNNRISIAQDQLYKIQIIVRSLTDKRLPSFDISDINFGDPCVEKEKYNIICKSLTKEHKVQEDRSAECFRKTLKSGDVDYQCKCAKHLFGKDCGTVQYCLLQHQFKNNKAKKFNMNGTAYCGEDAKCLNLELDVNSERKFVCACKKKTQAFNVDTRKCGPISDCALNKCNPQTQVCDSKTGKCKCKFGFELKRKECVRMATKCNATLSKCPDSRMDCYRDSITLSPICTCPAGFITLETGECRSNLCQYPGATNCEQDCENIEEYPYFKCRCDSGYYKLKTTKVNNNVTYACELRRDVVESCSQCKAEDFKICVRGTQRCVCKPGFIENDKGECILSPTTRWSSCPNGRIKIDDLTRRTVCDCSTSGYFEDQTALKGSCRLTKNICLKGEIGRQLCGSRNAGCLPSPFDLDDFVCTCPEDKILSNGRNSMTRAEMQKNPLVKCIDQCDLPHRSYECAAMGARCNWFSKLSSPLTPNYCECIPGTFYDSSSHKCVEESSSISLDISLHMAQLHMEFIEEVLRDRQEYPKNLRYNQTRQHMMLKIIDPLGFSQTALDAHHENIETFYRMDKVVGEIEKVAFHHMIAEQLLRFKLITEREDVQVVRLTKLDEVDTGTTSSLSRFNVRLAIRYKSKEDIILGLITSDNHEEFHTDLLKEFKDGLKKAIIDECSLVAGSKDLCIVPYHFGSPIMVKKSFESAHNRPCENGATCHGMSDCVSLNGSLFECKCNPDFFNVEQSFSFKSSFEDLSLRNEHCLPKALCQETCNSDNQECTEVEPNFDEKLFEWKKSAQCSCKEGYADSDGKCIGVCQLAACTSDGKCVQNGPHKAVCECKDGFYGAKCEDKLSKDLVWIIVVSVLGVALLVSVGAAIYFFMKRSSNSRNSLHHPEIVHNINSLALPPRTNSQQQHQSSVTESAREFQYSTTNAHHQQDNHSVRLYRNHNYVNDPLPLEPDESLQRRIIDAVYPHDSYSPSKHEKRVFNDQNSQQ